MSSPGLMSRNFFVSSRSYGSLRGPPTKCSSACEPIGTPRPIIIFDVMDTIVRDPFYTAMPGFFGMTMNELLAAKHPESWLLFERGFIDEDQLLDEFFLDGRDFNKRGLVEYMQDKYEFVAQMDSLLSRLKAGGYQMHICSNYPVWYRLIEEKLKLSRWMDWTFMSCEGPMKGSRKPEPAVFEILAKSLNVSPQDLLLVDDRKANIEGANACGVDGILFQGAEHLDSELMARGFKY